MRALICAGVYSKDLFVAEAARAIRNHPTAHPMYMYLAFQNNHDPYEVPQSYRDMYPGVTGSRGNFSGMITALDDAIGNVCRQ